jgi:hypothetical protein
VERLGLADSRFVAIVDRGAVDFLRSRRQFCLLLLPPGNFFGFAAPVTQVQTLSLEIGVTKPVVYRREWTLP